MKKICICTTVSITMKAFVVPLAEHLHHACGYDVTLMCDTDEAFAKSLPEYIHYIPIPIARGINASGMTSVIEFIKVFRREKFDMVQYSTPNAACYASIAAKLCRVPIRLYCQWGIRYVGLSGLSRRIFKWIEKIICKNSTRIHAVSHLNMEYAMAEKLYPRDKARVVGNGGTIGVDMREYDLAEKAESGRRIRLENGIEQDAFVFGFSGRISVDKGCRELFLAFKEISEAIPEARLLIVGPWEDDCGIDPELMTWIKSSGAVVLTGNIAEAKMKHYYSAMDCLVHPTYREGFGMVIQEAGALAVPVITTNIAGASEVMVAEESCLLIEAKNVEQLKTAMLALVSDRALTSSLGKNAYERTCRLYSREIMLENQKEAYRDILGSENENRIVG